MDARKRKRLEAAGWQVGSTTEFLNLSTEEAALVETRLAVSGAIRTRREATGLTQVALAKQLRFAEAADQFRAVLRLESTNQAALQFLQKIQALTNAPGPLLPAPLSLPR